MAAPTTRVKDLMELERIARRVKQRGEPEAAPQLNISEQHQRNIFNIFDSDEVGTVPSADLAMMLQSVGMVVDNESIKSLVDTYAEDDLINFAAFQSILKEVVTPRDSAAEATRVFNLIDADGTGEITVETLKEALEEADARVTTEELTVILKYCDVDGDGKLSLKDWLDVMSFIVEVQA